MPGQGGISPVQAAGRFSSGVMRHEDQTLLAQFALRPWGLRERESLLHQGMKLLMMGSPLMVLKAWGSGSKTP